jgi:hypothetical protein
MTLATDIKPKSRFRGVLGIGLAIVVLSVGVGYFTLPYISA